MPYPVIRQEVFCNSKAQYTVSERGGNGMDSLPSRYALKCLPCSSTDNASAIVRPLRKD